MSNIIVRDLDTLFSLHEILESKSADNVSFDKNLIAENLTPNQLETLLRTTYKYINIGLDFDNIFKDEGNSKSKMNSIQFIETVTNSGWDEDSDFDRFLKPYKCDKPFSFNYLGDFPHSKNINSLDPYAIYNRVLGGPFDFLPTLIDAIGSSKIDTWIELMSGSAKAALSISWAKPDINIILVDLDPTSFEYCSRYPWNTLPFTFKGDVTKLPVFNKIKTRSSRNSSVSFIGKQSHCFFDYNGILQVIKNASYVSKYLIIECCGVDLSTENLDDTSDLSTAISNKLGLQFALESHSRSNPLTWYSSFSLDAIYKESRRVFFGYPWIISPPYVVANLAKMLGLKVKWLDHNNDTFLPVDNLKIDDVDDDVIHLLIEMPKSLI